MIIALAIAGFAASVIIVITVQLGSIARTRIVCETDVEIARIAAGQTTSLDIRVDRTSKHHVSAELADGAKAIGQAGRSAERLIARTTVPRDS